MTSVHEVYNYFEFIYHFFSELVGDDFVQPINVTNVVANVLRWSGFHCKELSGQDSQCTPCPQGTYGSSDSCKSCPPGISSENACFVNIIFLKSPSLLNNSAQSFLKYVVHDSEEKVYIQETNQNIEKKKQTVNTKMVRRNKLKDHTKCQIFSTLF